MTEEWGGLGIKNMQEVTYRMEATWILWSFMKLEES